MCGCGWVGVRGCVWVGGCVFLLVCLGGCCIVGMSVNGQEEWDVGVRREKRSE